MLTIIHGDNQFASRKELEKIRNSATAGEVVRLDGKKLSLTEVIQSMEASSFFGGEKLIIIENLLSQNIKEKRVGELIEYLKGFKGETNCIIWEGRQINKSILTKFPEARVIFCKLEKLVFQFVDSLRPNNAKIVLSLFHKTLEHDGVEMIFFMIVRQFRHLILVKNRSTFLDALSPWQEQRVKIQAEYFSLNELEKAYGNLLEIDYSIKSGRSAFDLCGRLDMFLLNL